MRYAVVLAHALWLVACSHELAPIRDQADIKPPVIYAFSPVVGMVGQTVVAIDGEGFTADTRVFFGSQPATWAIGPDYVYSENRIWAIPPFGTMAEIEIRAENAYGNATARDLFRVFGGEPEILEAAPERVTQTTELRLRGSNFNDLDDDARLLIGDREVPDPVVTKDEIMASLSRMSELATFKTGWSVARYRFTPYVAGDLDETGVPIYVLRAPRIVRTDKLAYPGGQLMVVVTGYDAYASPLEASFADNLFRIADTAAPIRQVELGYDLGPSFVADDVPVRVVIDVPDVPPGSSIPLTFTTAAGTVRSNIVVAEPGHPPAQASLSCVDVRAKMISGASTATDLGGFTKRPTGALRDWSAGDAIFTLTDEGLVTGLWTAARRSAFPDAKFVHALAHLGDNQPDYFIALLSDEPYLDNGSPRLWLAVVYDEAFAAIEVSECQTPGACAGNYSPKLVLESLAGMEVPRLAVELAPTSDADGKVFLFTLPDPAAFGSGGLGYVEVPYTQAGTPQQVALSRDGIDTLVGLGFSSTVLVQRMSATAFISGTTFSFIGEVLALDVDGTRRFSAVENGGTVRVHSLGVSPTSDTSYLYPTAGTWSPTDATVVSGRRWLSTFAGDLHGFGTSSSGQEIDLSLPLGYTRWVRLIANINSIEGVLAADWSGNPLLTIVRAGGGVPAGSESIAYDLVLPRLDYAPPVSCLNRTDRICLFGPEGPIEVALATRTVTTKPYSLPARRFIEGSGSFVFASILAEASSAAPTLINPHPLIWSGTQSTSTSDLVLSDAYQLREKDDGSLPVALARATPPAQSVYVNPYLVASYRPDVTAPSLELDLVSGSVTTLGSAPLPLPVGIDSAQALNAVLLEQQRFSILVAPDLDPRRHTSSVAYLVASGALWQGVYRSSTQASNSGFARLTTLDGLAIEAASIDRDGKRLFVLAANPSGNTVHILPLDDTTATPVQLTLDGSSINCAGDIRDLCATRDGLIVATDNGYVCGYRVEGGASWTATPLFGSQSAQWHGIQPGRSLRLTPDESELWLVDHVQSFDPDLVPLGFQMRRLAVQSGAVVDELAPPSGQYILDWSLAGDGRSVLMTTTTNSSLRADQIVGQAPAQLCRVE